MQEDDGEELDLLNVFRSRDDSIVSSFATFTHGRGGRPGQPALRAALSSEANDIGDKSHSARLVSPSSNATIAFTPRDSSER